MEHGLQISLKRWHFRWNIHYRNVCIEIGTAELAELMCRALNAIVELIGFKRRATVEFNCWIKFGKATIRCATNYGLDGLLLPSVLCEWIKVAEWSSYHQHPGIRRVFTAVAWTGMKTCLDTSLNLNRPLKCAYILFFAGSWATTSRDPCRLSLVTFPLFIKKFQRRICKGRVTFR